MLPIRPGPLILALMKRKVLQGTEKYDHLCSRVGILPERALCLPSSGLGKTRSGQTLLYRASFLRAKFSTWGWIVRRDVATCLALVCRAMHAVIYLKQPLPPTFVRTARSLLSGTRCASCRKPCWIQITPRLTSSRGSGAFVSDLCPIPKQAHREHPVLVAVDYIRVSLVTFRNARFDQGCLKAQTGVKR